MPNKFTPPIATRTTDELLKIAGASEKWNSRAVDLAYKELSKRKIDPEKIKMAQHLSEKRERLEVQKKAEESYHLLDFIFDPLVTFIEITFSWELRKDGFERKAQKQKYFRLGLLFVILVGTIIVLVAP